MSLMTGTTLLASCAVLHGVPAVPAGRSARRVAAELEWRARSLQPSAPLARVVHTHLSVRHAAPKGSRNAGYCLLQACESSRTAAQGRVPPGGGVASLIYSGLVRRQDERVAEGAREGEGREPARTSAVGWGVLLVIGCTHKRLGPVPASSSTPARAGQPAWWT